MSIPSRSSVSLGVVPTHVKFVGGIVPDEQGKLPRDPDGQLVSIPDMSKCTVHEANQSFKTVCFIRIIGIVMVRIGVFFRMIYY